MELLSRKANKAAAELWEYELAESKKGTVQHQKGKYLSTLALMNMLDSKMVTEGSHLTQVRERLSKRGDNVSVAEFQEILVEARTRQPTKSALKRVKRPKPIDVDFRASRQLQEMERGLIQKPAAPERDERGYCGCRSCQVF